MRTRIPALARTPLAPALAAGCVGVATGGGIWLFKQGIRLVEAGVERGRAPAVAALGSWAAALAPMAGGLVVGLLLALFVRRERHHGVAGVMEAVALAGGRLRWRRVPIKVAGAAISIGSGASVGPEDPSVQIGSGIGSLFGQVLRMSDERVRALVAAGAASGIAAAFRAPIAGVFFALEILLGEVSGAALGLVLLAAVVASAAMQALAGTLPEFHVPEHAFGQPAELPLHVCLGVAAAVVSVLYVRGFDRAHGLIARSRVPAWLRPAVAGLAVGLVGLVLPRILGVGYGTMQEVLVGSPSLGAAALAGLLLARLVLTPLCIAAGFPGGVFAPALFQGAMLGALFAVGARALFPGLELHAGAYAMVGMAAVLAGSVHAPLTAVLLVFELTRDYRTMLPVMLAVGTSYMLSLRFGRDSVYTAALARKGIRLERGRDIEVLDSLRVEEVMERQPPTLAPDQTLAEAEAVLERTHRNGLLVVDAGREVVGVLTVTDVERARARGATCVGDACTRSLVVAYPQESLGSALRRMAPQELGRLPVVDPERPTRLLGALRRTDVIRAYDLAARRRAASRHRAQQVRLGATGEVEVLEVEVAAGSPSDGKAIRDLAWPPGSVVASLRRGSVTLVPKGDTLLLAGDVLAVVAASTVHEQVRTLCQP